MLGELADTIDKLGTNIAETFGALSAKPVAPFCTSCREAPCACRIEPEPEEEETPKPQDMSDAMTDGLNTVFGQHERGFFAGATAPAATMSAAPAPAPAAPGAN